MWRSIDAEPLSEGEIARVRVWHLSLRCTKPCISCGQQQPVQRFSSYGARCCLDCVSESPHEEWWQSRKKALAR
jgi:hypothetical protein